jgi:DNA-binding MarR family transcriptional regulator
MCIPRNQVLWNKLPRDALASLSAMPDLPALFADLVRLEIELWDAVEARLRAELGVGLGTAQTLAVVAAVENCRVHDIVRGLSITVGGASKTVDRLERNALVARRPNPSDRRSSVIELTRNGAATHAKAERLIAAELDARIGGALSDRALGQLHSAIAKLRAALAAG